MDIEYGVTTAPRRVSYLEQTLESLAQAGFTDPLVSHDDIGSGSYRNFKRTLLQLIERNPQADAYAVFQDDIVVSRNLREFCDTLWPEPAEQIGVASLYCAHPHQFNRTGWNKLPLQPEDGDEGLPELCRAIAKAAPSATCFPQTRLTGLKNIKVVRTFRDRYMACGFAPESMRGGRRIPAQWEWMWVLPLKDGVCVSHAQQWAMASGACALVLPRQNAQRIVESCRHQEAKTKTDIHVAEVCARLKLSWWQFSPSLVEHVGATSAINEDSVIDKLTPAGENHRQAVHVLADAREVA